MISNVDQLKKLIEWCKANKIKKLKIKDIEFEISELDFLPEQDTETPINNNLGLYNEDTLADTEKSVDPKNDPDLFWSTQT